MDLLHHARLSPEATDYHTGKTRWTHEAGAGGSGAGVITTDSGLTITGDDYGNVLVLDTSNGKTLWHAGMGSPMESSPISYELDGRQYIMTSSGGVLFAWALPEGRIGRNAIDMQHNQRLSADFSLLPAVFR